MDKENNTDPKIKCIFDGDECSNSSVDYLLYEDLDKIEKLQVQALSEGDSICLEHFHKEIRLFSARKFWCCDPLQIHSKVIKTDLCTVDRDIHKQYHHATTFDLIPGEKICRNCLFKRLPQWLELHPPETVDPEPPNKTPNSSESQNPESQNSIQATSQSSDGSAKQVAQSIMFEETVKDIHNLYNTLEMDEKFESRRVTKRYLEEAEEKITETVRKKLRILEPSHMTAEESAVHHIQEIVDQIKDRLAQCESYNEKCFVLSVLPQSWSAHEISVRIGVSWHLAQRSKDLVVKRGILRMPSVKMGKKLDERTLELVQNFYLSDEVSRVMPGLNDCKTYRVDGVKITEQRRLLLNNLKELWTLFKELYPNEKIGFSKFAMARPPHCVFADAPGTHSVCVCCTHQNMKVLLSSLDLSTLDPGNDWNYKFLLSRLVCAQPSENCYFGTCKSCPSIDDVITDIAGLLDRNEITEVSYKQWISTDRANIVTLVRPVYEILESLKDELPGLLRHDFIARSQAAYLRELKESLSIGHIIVTGDFAENLSLLVQDAIQKWHWANEQVTIHPWVCYYKDLNGDLQHLSFAMISDCLSHDIYTVATFQRRLISLLKARIPDIKKVSYFTDGAGSQYKNRFNSTNICYHEADHGMPAFWHFYATSHGKGPCDAIGGKLKRCVRRASLQRPLENQITSARDVFEWAKNWDSKIICEFVSEGEIEQMREDLSERFSKAKTIKGTLKLHCFEPISTEEMRVETHSSSSNHQIVKLRN